MASPTVAELGKAACLTEADVNYLAAKGYSSIAMIARSAKDDAEFLRRIVEPFCTGVTMGNVDYKAVGNADLVEARFLVLFDESKNVRQKALAASAAPAATTALALRAPTGASGPILDPKTYLDKVEAWQNGWQPKRTFPQHLIQGADHVLLRLLDEHTNSRFYTPLHLGEIVQSRAHNTDGSINLARVDKPRRDDRVVLTTSGVEYEAASPDPLSEADRWKIYDALVANGWALRWAGYSSDLETTQWTDWLVSELRTPGNIEVFKVFYHTCSWRIAFAMRNGIKFDAEVTAIMKDDEWVRKTKLQIKEKMASPGATPKFSQPQGPPPRRGRSPKGSPERRQYRSRSPRGPPAQKGRSKGASNKGKGQQDKKSNVRSHSRGGTEICKQFNQGNCKKRGKNTKGHGRECNFSHECTNCKSSNCVGASLCRR